MRFEDFEDAFYGDQRAARKAQWLALEWASLVVRMERLGW